MKRKKADHKHIYEECLIRKSLNRYDSERGFVNRDTLIKGLYCTICGKLKEKQYFLTAPVEGNPNARRMLLDNDEIMKVYSGLPVLDGKDE